MRSLLALFVALGLLGSAAHAAPAPSVAILPPGAAPEDEALALVIQTRASGLLATAGGYQEVHAKMILRVADRERLTGPVMATPAGASMVARRLGARSAVYSTLEQRNGGGWTLQAAMVTGGKKDPRAKPVTLTLPPGAPEAVEQAAAALATLAASPEGKKIGPAARPLTASAPAMAAYARCLALVLKQPIVLEAPVMLEEAQIKDAITSCRAAVAADANFMDARAALGLALALAGQDEDAVEVVAGVKEEGGAYLPFYWLARYWLVTRFQSVDAGATGLKKAIERHPYFLLARGYLAEHEHALHHDEAALAAWRSYRDQVPGNNFIRGRISRSLARMGKTREALDEARAAHAADPTDRELTLELAGRMLDAGKAAAAVSLLRPLTDDPQTRAEVLLRLGYAYQKQGNAAAAETWIRKAEAAAQRPADWRTRARARLDLGMMMVKQGKVEEGQKVLVAAKKGGLEKYIASQQDQELSEMVKQAEVAQSGKTIEETLFSPPTEVSPFEYDGAGAIIRDHDKPPAPKFFEVLRF